MSAFEQAVSIITASDDQHPPQSYYFLREALNFTLDRAKEKHGENAAEHVDAKEFLFGYRDYALREFGPLAWSIMRDWHIHHCTDVGKMVFLLIEHGVMGKNADDHPDDFTEVYHMEMALRAPYLPNSKLAQA